jgi:16S rRNA (cytosine1402-N4)-methyltransferase
MKHVPVMVSEVLQYVLSGDPRLVCDATVGCGGHTMALLEAHTSLQVIGIDRDPQALQEAEKTLRKFGARVQLIRGNYADVGRLLSSRKVDGILLDLGLSSLQLDQPDRGFSYSEDGPLDMQMSVVGGTARELINDTDVKELGAILKNYGEVKRPMQIARAIKSAADAGTMNTTADLRNAVDAALRGAPPRSLLSKVFQALRVAVNHELENLDRLLDNCVANVKRGGTIVILSYHSLEDRKIKTFFRRESRDCVCPPRMPVCTCGHKATLELLTRRAVTPTTEESKNNPRARSARLRAARVIVGEH